MNAVFLFQSVFSFTMLGQRTEIFFQDIDPTCPKTKCMWPTVQNVSSDVGFACLWAAWVSLSC